jgi:hypothetical protein
MGQDTFGSGRFKVYPKKRAHSINLRPDELSPGRYVSYDATGTSTGPAVATRLVLFATNDVEGEAQFFKVTEPSITAPDYKRGTPGTIRFRSGNSIEIVPDENAQRYVQAVGMRVASDHNRGVMLSGSLSPGLRFFVVRPFRNNSADRLISIGAQQLKDAGWSVDPLVTRNRETVNDVVETPEGDILVPDTVLARLDNEAELAFLLSVASEATYQHLPYFMAAKFDHMGDLEFTSDAAIAQDQRMIRMAIRNVLLAGFDVREAPFAWATAHGAMFPNPAIESSPDVVPFPAGSRLHDEGPGEFPWYSDYAFAYIHRYFADEDFAMLKCGEKEYAQFLDELRKADPDVFAQSRK